MDDSEESELLFVVPSSVENSRAGDNLEDPLGLSAEAQSAGIVDSSSFSCFELSGRTQEHNSESLRIDEPHDNIMPPSPDVMHIDLSATPSLEPTKGDQGTLSKSAEEMNLNDGKDSGRMSPDMMVSGDCPYRNDKFIRESNCKLLSNDDKGKLTDHELEKLKCDEIGKENLPVPDFTKDKSSINYSNISDPYNAETQPYVEPESASDSKNEASYSMSHYLPPSTDKDSNSAPIFVTASSQADSEKPGSFHPEAETANDKTSDAVINKSPQKEQLGYPSSHQDVQAQEISQDCLNLHLSMESQTSVGMSLPLAGDEGIMHNDQAQNGDSAVNTDHHTSHETMHQATSNVNSSVPLSSSMPQTGESALQSTVDESGSGFSMECSRATTFASEENLEITESKMELAISKDTHDIDSKENDLPVQMTIPEDNNSAAGDHCSSQIAKHCHITKEKLVIQSSIQNENMAQVNLVQPLLIYEGSSNSNGTNYGILTKSPGNSDEGPKETFSLIQSGGMYITSKDESGEINPSMQSTYINETGTPVLIDGPPPFPSQDLGLWIDSGSASKGTSDSPYMDSSNFSMDYSIPDKDRIRDLETQAFTASSASGLNKPGDNQCQKTSITTQPGNENCSSDVIVLVKDISPSVTDSVTKNKAEEMDKSCSTSSDFANPSLPKHKSKPLCTNSTCGDKPMENDDIVEQEQNVDQDKSSDTIPVDENSDHEIDHKESPKNVSGYVYRVTRSEVVETLFNGEVVDRKVLPRKIKYLKKCPAKVFSQTSGGSGYLADTSSLSRSSSNVSAKTNLTDSPAFEGPERSLRLDLVPHNELGTGITSSSDSSQNSRISTQNNSDTQTATKSKVFCLTSSPLSKKMSSPMVVLTPMSTQQLVAHHAQGIIGTENVATPPLTNINPPISGSTPVAFEHKSDTSSDVTNPNSPEFSYTGEPLAATPETLVESSQPSTSAAQKISKRSEDKTTEGIPVMARPSREVFFYPGTMHGQDPLSGKCTVVFDDNQRKSEIRESDVLLVDKLEVGQEVFVHSEDTDWYQAGTILSFCQFNNESGYLVEVESDSDTTPKKTKRFSKKDVIIKRGSLSREQKRSFVQPINNVATSSDVSLDNVMDGKRKSRRPSRGCDVKSTSSPILTKTLRSLRKRRLEPDTPAQREDLKRTKLICEKIKYSGSKPLFRNICFLLTCRSRQCQLYESDSDSSYADTAYSKEDIESKIKTGSGQVVKDFSSLMSSKCAKAFVISNSYCRTMNYLRALATGMECVSYQWIADSTDTAELLPMEDYVLPAGYSLQQEKVVERLKIPLSPLQGMKVLLRLKDSELWRPLLTETGCDVVTYMKKFPNDPTTGYDVIIADSSTIAEIRRSTPKSLPTVVSVEWVIQCLINSEKLPFDGHEQYRF